MSRLVNALKKAQEPDEEVQDGLLESGADSFDGFLDLDLEFEGEGEATHSESDESDSHADGYSDSLTLDLDDIDHSPESAPSVDADEETSNNLYQKILQDDIDNLLSESDGSGDQEKSFELHDEAIDAESETESEIEALAEALVPAAELVDAENVSTNGPAAEQKGEAETLSIADRFANKQARDRNKKQRIQWSLAGISALGIASAATFFFAGQSQSSHFDSGASADAYMTDESQVVANLAEGDELLPPGDKSAEDPLEVSDSISSKNTAADDGPVKELSAPAGTGNGPVSKIEVNSDSQPIIATANKPVGVSFEKTRVETTLSSVIKQAYTAYNEQNFELAESLYVRALSQDPNSVQAMNGLGSIAFKEGDFSQAKNHFHNARNADASNAYALAMLQKIAGIETAANDVDTVAASKNFVSTRAADYYAMGYSLAVKKHWPEAQAMFFQAVSLEPKNANHLYHLAVSLDQLNKHRLALTYYEQAVALSSASNTRFDVDAATLRVQQLKTTLVGNR